MVVQSARLLNVREAAEVLSISQRTLHEITVPRGILPCVRIGKSIRYSPSTLEQFIRTQQGLQS